MCQAYEGERNAIISGEHFASIRGFKAALLNQSETYNQCGGDMYASKAYDHGFDCYQGRILPYAMELKYRDYCETVLKKEWYGYGLKNLRDIENEFKKTGELPEILKKLLS